MRRPLPVWLAAVLPATLVGHALAYAVTGQSMADGRHGYFSPLFDCSIAALLTLCIGLIAAAVTRAGSIERLALDPSVLRLWLRLAPLQLALFWLIERSEGFTPELISYGVQLLVACAFAFALACIANVFARCVRGALGAAVYLCRLLESLSPSRIAFAPVTCSFALQTRAGESRFERPPPSR